MSEKKQIDTLAADIYSMLRSDSMSRAMASMLYGDGWRKQSEVAREIFEEIEDSIAVHAFTRKSEDYAEGMYDAIEWVDSKIAELKKKYTGEQI